MRVPDNLNLIIFPKSRPDGIVHLLKRQDDFGNYFRERLCRVHGNSQFLEALEKNDMQHKEIQEETNSILTASNASRKPVKKENGIPPSPETDNNTRKIQSSDNKRIVRSKAKIYSYRDSDGRLVFTNYCRSKSKTNKK